MDSPVLAHNVRQGTRGGYRNKGKKEGGTENKELGVGSGGGKKESPDSGQ